MKTYFIIPIILTLAIGPLLGAEKTDDGVEHINALVTKGRGSPVTLQNKESISTRATFKPPVQITIAAKTDANDLRVGYAANQVIFNWENSPSELRIDGGPANGKHKSGAGLIPKNKYVTIRWIVTATKQQIYVDDQLRYEHEGDYSKIDNPVSVYSWKSKVSVRTIKVKPL